MRVLGIDPGTAATGYGIVEEREGSLHAVCFGAITPPASHPFAQRPAVLDADGTYLGKCRKMHIPDDPLYYEKFYFAPGDAGFRIFDTAVGRIGVLICWDQWYPEAARLTALRGAQILYPTAIGWLPAEKAEYGAAQKDAWTTMQRSHAIANGVFVVAVNRVGHEGLTAPNGIDFWGGSFVADPYGSVLAKAGEGEEGMVVECNLALTDVARTHWPFLRDRRLSRRARARPRTFSCVSNDSYLQSLPSISI